MAKQTTHTFTALDILRIAWALSAIPLAIGFVMDTAAPFSTTPPPTKVEEVFVWVMFALFAALQTAVTIVSWSRPHFTIRTLGALCVSLLLLWPEYYLGATAAILFRWAVTLAVVVVVGVYLMRFNKVRRSSPQDRRKS